MSRVASVRAWFLVWPDRTVHQQWGYATLRDLKEQSPGLITGAVATWNDLSRMGYGYVRCTITPAAKARAASTGEQVSKAAPGPTPSAKLTPWFPGTAKPARKGWYEALSSSWAEGNRIVRRYWDGREWMWLHPDTKRLRSASFFTSDQWRGLASKP